MNRRAYLSGASGMVLSGMAGCIDLFGSDADDTVEESRGTADDVRETADDADDRGVVDDSDDTDDSDDSGVPDETNGTEPPGEEDDLTVPDNPTKSPESVVTAYYALLNEREDAEDYLRDVRSIAFEGGRRHSWVSNLLEDEESLAEFQAELDAVGEYEIVELAETERNVTRSDLKADYDIQPPEERNGVQSEWEVGFEHPNALVIADVERIAEDPAHAGPIADYWLVAQVGGEWFIVGLYWWYDVHHFE